MSRIEAVSSSVWTSLRKLMLGPTVTAEDLRRWAQGFVWCESPSFGLRQSEGGPCGVLAACQAEVLYHLFFAPDASYQPPSGEGEDLSLPNPDIVTMEALLIKGMCSILTRALPEEAQGEYYHMLEIASSSSSPSSSGAGDEWDLATCLGNTEPTEGLFVHTLSSEAAVQDFLRDRMATLRGPSGVLMFLLSVLLTHGTSRARDDMDDPENSMLGQFGHCTQDLINLLLSGRSVSNVFDGSVPLGGPGDETGFMLKGIQKRCRVGYLSHLESMRYVAVGENYKKPEVPVWVLGSSSHFTVLFSLQSAVNEETNEEKMLSKAQQAFRAADTEECGFVQSNRLDGILVDLGLPIVSDPVAMDRLRNLLTMDGDLVLWQTFWENISQLLSGEKTLDQLVEAKAAAFGGGGGGGGGGAFVAQAAGADNMSGATRPRSDSDIARELQNELNAPASSAQNPTGNKASRTGSSSDSSSIQQLDFSSLLGSPTTMESSPPPSSSSASAPLGGLDFSSLLGTATATPSGTPAAVPTPTPTPAPAPAPEPSTTFMRSDSDLARQLQSQWAEEDSAQTVTAAVGSPSRPPAAAAAVVALTTSPLSSSAAGTGAAQGGASPEMRHRADSIARGPDAISWRVFHFNGMETNTRRARLAPLTMKTRSHTSSIGIAVALSAEVAGGMSGSHALEEIMRTRWPGCIVDCQGELSPSID